MTEQSEDPNFQAELTPTASGSDPWKRTFESLRVRNFRLYSASNLLAMTAVWMQRIAQDWLVLQLTGSVADVGITVAMQFAPMLFFGLYGGVLIDRYPKRILLICTQSSAGVLSAILGILSLTGVVQSWEVWIIALLGGFVTVIDNPTRQVFVNEMVGPRYLRNAITLNSSGFQLGALLGPAVSGLLIDAVGAGWSFCINSVACAVTVFVLTRLAVGELIPIASAPRKPGQLREGIRYVVGTPVILWSIIMLSFVSVFALNMPVLLAAFAKNIYDVGASGYGFFNTLVAVGALTGSLLSTRRRSLRLRTVILSAATWSAILVVTAIMPGEAAFGVMLVAAGVANQFFFMAGNPLVQMTSRLQLRGRVMSMWVLVLLGGQALGAPAMGAFVARFGPQFGMVIAGGVPLVASLAIGGYLARTRQLHPSVRVRRGIPSIRIVRSHGRGSATAR
jgi:predicted MFS family arabinose efflux permease